MKPKFADDTTSAEKYRKDFQYRHSLTAISERRNLNQSVPSKELAKLSRYFKNDFLVATNVKFFSRPSQSLDYSNSDRKDSLIDVSNHQNGLDDKCSASLSSSSYLSWIESVNSEYFETVMSNEPGKSIKFISHTLLQTFHTWLWLFQLRT